MGMITIDMVTGDVTTTTANVKKTSPVAPAPLSLPEPALQPRTIEQAQPVPMPAPVAQINIEQFINSNK